MSPEELLALRASNELHPKTQDAIGAVLKWIPTETYGLPEAWGISGGQRADFVIFVKQRKLVHFEVFGHPSTVFRDVNILHMSRADVKVALILDREADPRVAEAYFRAVGERFDYYWLSVFLDLDRRQEALAILTRLLEKAIESGGPLKGPSANVGPAGGAPFSKATVRVSGFHPYSRLMVFWDPDGHTSVVGGGSDTDSAGEGECVISVPDGRIADLGRHTLRVVDSVGNAASTTFEVTTAWPSPYLRASPASAKPDESVTVVGGGAPAQVGIRLFLWSGNLGHGVLAVRADAQGQFQGSLKIPWVVNLELVKSGRHRVSASPDEGGFPYEASTFIEVPNFSPPDTLEWGSPHSSCRDGICLLNPMFSVHKDEMTVRFRIRNDRPHDIRLIPGESTAIVELDRELREKHYMFECLGMEGRCFTPGEEGESIVRLRRLFRALPKSLIPPARTLIANLFFQTADEQVVKVQLFTVWPAEIWAE